MGNQEVFLSRSTGGQIIPYCYTSPSSDNLLQGDPASSIQITRRHSDTFLKRPSHTSSLITEGLSWEKEVLKRLREARPMTGEALQEFNEKLRETTPLTVEALGELKKIHISGAEQLDCALELDGTSESAMNPVNGPERTSSPTGSAITVLHVDPDACPPSPRSDKSNVTVIPAGPTSQLLYPLTDDEDEDPAALFLDEPAQETTRNKLKKRRSTGKSLTENARTTISSIGSVLPDLSGLPSFKSILSRIRRLSDPHRIDTRELYRGQPWCWEPDSYDDHAIPRWHTPIYAYAPYQPHDWQFDPRRRQRRVGQIDPSTSDVLDRVRVRMKGRNFVVDQLYGDPRRRGDRGIWTQEQKVNIPQGATHDPLDYNNQQSHGSFIMPATPVKPWENWTEPAEPSSHYLKYLD